MTVKEFIEKIEEWKEKGWITDDNKIKVQNCYGDHTEPYVFVSDITGNVLIDWK